MRDLERRYRRLLCVYPAAYRQARGAELVGTYLDLVDPGRRWPSIPDAADLLAGGVRERLRAAGAADLIPGLHLAAVLAFAAATGLAGFWATAEVVTIAGRWGSPAFGPFATTGMVIWVSWLLAAAVHALGPAGWARAAIGLALLLTAVVVPVAALLEVPRPYLFVLLPQAVLGLLALAIPSGSARHRLLPVPSALVAAFVAAGSLSGESAWFYRVSYGAAFLFWAGAVLLLTATLGAAVLSLHRDARGMWALLFLLTPVGLLFLAPLSEEIASVVGAHHADFRVRTGTAAAVLIAGVIPLGAALAFRASASAATSHSPVRTPERCPACGR